MKVQEREKRGNDMRGTSLNRKNLGGPEVWKRVCARLFVDLTQAEYDKWISSLRFISEVDGSVLIAARTKFAFDRVNTQYKRAIERAWTSLDPKRRSIRLECWTSTSGDIKALVDDPWAEQVKSEPHLLPVESDPSKTIMGPGVMRFDTLVTGHSNSVAATVARSIAQQREQVPASIIVINGLQGVGKTHLLKAVEAALEVKEDQRVAYISAEEFLVSYVDGAKSGDTRALKARVRDADIVLFDDLQTIAGKKGTNDELTGTLRTVTNRGGIVVLTSDRAPADLQGLSTGVMTVLKGAACIEISAPDTAMRLEIVRQRVEMLSKSAPNFQIDDAMCNEIVTRVQGPGRDLCGAVISLYTETGLGSVAPTMEMLNRVLSRQQKPKQVTMDMIKRAVCKTFDITRADLIGKRKFQRFVRARQVGMYLARELTDKSFPQIGIAFGNRHHTTALYAWRKLTKKLPDRPELVGEIERAKQVISQLQSDANL